ncbi:MAG TPA: hypothetical protein VM843_07200 [Flavisolibacter sp.]|jgi:hypothetical protein|nr:hypothetical protein [Flavisolibacter sp.]
MASKSRFTVEVYFASFNMGVYDIATPMGKSAALLSGAVESSASGGGGGGGGTGPGPSLFLHANSNSIEQNKQV